MRIEFFALLTIAISLPILSLFVIGISYGQENQTSTYENTTEGIKFQYPSYWGNLTNERGCIHNPCLIPLQNDEDMTNRSSFGIIRMFDKVSGLHPTCDCDTLIEFVRWAYPALPKAFQDFTLINDNQTVVGKNNSAWQIEFQATPKGLPHENTTKLVVFTKANSKFYTISFGPFSEQSKVKQLPEFKKVIESMEFSPIQISTPRIPSFMNLNETKESIPETSIDNNPSGLQILSQNSFTDSLGYMHVVGEIKNNYPSTVTFVKIIGTFYDVNNIVVGTEFTYANPSDITSGQKAPFELLLTSASVPISQIDHYNLQATSQ